MTRDADQQFNRAVAYWEGRKRNHQRRVADGTARPYQPAERVRSTWELGRVLEQRDDGRVLVLFDEVDAVGFRRPDPKERTHLREPWTLMRVPYETPMALESEQSRRYWLRQHSVEPETRQQPATDGVFTLDCAARLRAVSGSHAELVENYLGYQRLVAILLAKCGGSVGITAADRQLIADRCPTVITSPIGFDLSHRIQLFERTAPNGAARRGARPPEPLSRKATAAMTEDESTPEPLPPYVGISPRDRVRAFLEAGAASDVDRGPRSGLEPTGLIGWRGHDGYYHELTEADLWALVDAD